MTKTDADLEMEIDELRRQLDEMYRLKARIQEKIERMEDKVSERVTQRYGQGLKPGDVLLMTHLAYQHIVMRVRDVRDFSVHALVRLQSVDKDSVSIQHFDGTTSIAGVLIEDALAMHKAFLEASSRD